MFSAVESTAYYEDDYFYVEGFENYDATTVDPGPWTMVVTMTVCFLSMISVPIMVVLGERYERRRRERQALEQQKLEEEAEQEAKHRQEEEKEEARKKPKGYRINIACSEDDAIEAERKSGRHFEPYHHPISNTSKSDLVSNMSHAKTTVSNKHSTRHVARTVMDRLLIPQYPDDDIEIKSKISFAPRSAKLGSAIGSMSTGLGESTLMGGTRSTTMLDAGAAGARRHRRGMAKKPGAYQHIVQRYTEEEDRLEMEWSGSNLTPMPVTPLQQHLTKNNTKATLAAATSNTKYKKKNIYDCNESASADQNSLSTWGRQADATVVDDISPNDAADAHDPGKDYLERYVQTTKNLDICCGPNAMWKWSTIVRAVDNLVTISEYDNEMKRILRLAVPFVTVEVVECVFDVVDVALVANFVGTDAAAAYVVADLFISMTHEFIAGIGDAQGTLCPHALGAGNNVLAAQYVQISIVVFLVVSAPILAAWWFFIDDALLWFGLSHHVAQIGLAWTHVAVAHYLVSGVSESVVGLLEISDHEVWVAIVDLIFGTLDMVATLLTVTTWKVTLTTVAWIHLGMEVLFFLFVVVAASRKGWYRQFYQGLLGSFAFKNVSAVKRLVMTAIPLSFGSFLAYSEWEIITLLASRLGPAEAVAWSFLGSIWEVFEATTEGLGEAAAIRISLHLGKGRPDLARLSSSKCLLISVLLSFFITSILFMCGDNIAIWLTKDETLQNMLSELLPLVGLGNVTMTFGMTAWHIIGAQGRYRLALVIAMICSWGLTIPLCLISVQLLNIDLKGLVSSVVIGYSVTGSVMACVLLRSDWERISQIIQDINRITGETYSDDSDNEDEQSEASKSFVPKSEDSSSESSDDDTDPSTRKGKKRISPKSVVSSALSAASSRRSRSRRTMRSSKSVVSRSASPSTLTSPVAASSLRKPSSTSKNGHMI